MNVKSLINEMLDSSNLNKLLYVQLGRNDTCACYTNYSNLFYDLLHGKQIKIKPLFSFNKEDISYENDLLDRGNLKDKQFFFKEDLKQLEKIVDISKIYSEKALFLLCKTNIAKQIIEDLTNLPQVYVSFVNLRYYSVNSQENLIGQLLFLKCKVLKQGEDYVLKGVSSDVVFNTTLLNEIREEHNIDLTYDYHDFVLNNYVQFVNDKVGPLLMNCTCDIFVNSVNVGLQNLINARSEVLDDNLDNLSNNLKAINEHIDIDEKYDFEKEDFGYGGPLTVPYKEMRANLDKYGIVKLNIDDKSFGKEILKRFNQEIVSKKNSVLYIEPNEAQAKQRRDEFLQEGFKGLLSEDSIDSCEINLVDSFKKAVEINHETYLTKQEEQTLTSFLDLKNKYIESKTKERAKLDFHLGDSYLVTTNKASYYYLKSDKIFDLEIEQYTDDDYAMDQVFISNLKNYGKFINTPLKDNPFYGVTTDLSENNFEEIKKNCANLKIKIDALKEYIAVENIANFGFGNANSITEVKNIIDALYVLIKYNGFDLRFFNIASNPLTKLKIDELAELQEHLLDKRNELQEFFKDKSFLLDNDVATLYNQIKDKTKQKRSAKKQIKRALVRKFGVFKKVYKMLPEYIERDNEFKKQLPDFEEVFGYTIYDVDGVSKIQQYIDYANEFISMKNTFADCDNVNFNSEFLTKFFTDPEYRSTVRIDLLPRLESLYSEVSEQFNSYSLLFDSDELTTMKFEKVPKLIDKKLNASYQEFEIYRQYMNEIEHTSDVFKQFHKMFVDKYLPMTSIENDYFASLFKSLSNRVYEEQDLSNEENIYLKSDYIKQLYLNKDLLNRYDVMKVTDYRTSILNSELFKERLKSLKYTYHYNQIPNIEKIVTALDSFYNSVLPITVETIDKVHYFSKLNFNYLIIDNSSQFSDYELLLLLTLNPNSKIVILSYSETPEIRLNLYPLVRVNFESILGIPYSYDKLFASFANQVELVSNKHGFEVNNNTASLDPLSPPLALYNPGINKVSHLLLPDCLYEIDDVENVEYSLRRFLLDTYNSTLFVINSLLIVYENQKAFNLTLRAYDQYLQKIKVEVKDVEKQTSDNLKSQGSKNEYEQRLALLQTCFKLYPKDDEINELLSNEKYVELLGRIVPCHVSTIERLNDRKLNEEITKYLKSNLLRIKNDMVYFSEYERNEFKLSSNRTLSDIDLSEFMNFIRVYISNFTFIKCSDLRKILATAVNLDETMESFIEKYNQALNYLVRHRYCSLNGDNIVLKR